MDSDLDCWVGKYFHPGKDWHKLSINEKGMKQAYALLELLDKLKITADK